MASSSSTTARMTTTMTTAGAKKTTTMNSSSSNNGRTGRTKRKSVLLLQHSKQKPEELPKLASSSSSSSSSLFVREVLVSLSAGGTLLLTTFLLLLLMSQQAILFANGQEESRSLLSSYYGLKNKKAKKWQQQDFYGPGYGPPPPGGRCLRQSDFDKGTYIIGEPGIYVLCEDITFHPNPPRRDQHASEGFQPDYSLYDPKNYGLGFFAAISVTTDKGVDIYLNGYTLKQSSGHALIQRFYANIELGRSPFIQGAGPADFGELGRAANVGIYGPGTLGRSSHHGIHGNDNENVKVVGVTFDDFEVAAVALNNVDGLLIENCKIPKNRRDVPVVGMFSSAHFIGPYGKYLRDHYPNRTISFDGGRTFKSSVELYDALMDSIDEVYDHVVRGEGRGTGFARAGFGRGRSGINKLYNNPFGVVDGPCYAFLVHGKGPAVNDVTEDFDENDDDSETSSNVVIRNNDIRNIKCWTKEIPAAVYDETVQTDARGAVFQLKDTFTNRGLAMNDDGTYKGNVVADMQIFVAQAIHEDIFPDDDPVLQTAVNTISEYLVRWATSGEAYLPYYRCNGDSMHHVGKGIIVIRVEDTKGFKILNNRIVNIENLSLMPHEGCDDLHAMTSSENPGEQQMGNVRGISVASFRPYSGSMYNLVEGNTIEDVDTLFGYYVIGIDVQGDSRGLIIRNNNVDVVPGEGPRDPRKQMSVRIREGVDRGSILIRDNRLDEGVIYPRGEPEQYVKKMSVGGCPFTQGLVFAPENNPHTDVERD